MLSKEFTFTYKDIPERKRKNLAILDCIRKRDTISRTDISRETGINIVSVSNYITNYIKNNLVMEYGYDTSTGGRRPELVRLNLEGAYAMGVDIGANSIIAVITDLSLKTRAKEVGPRPEGDMDDVISGTLDTINRVISGSGLPAKAVKLIGIGTSGIVDIQSGTIHDTDYARGRTTTNLFNLARSIEDKFNITTFVANDATCAAFGELSLSPRSDILDMLYLYSDLGCGIIMNGDIYCGVSGGAGEIQLRFGQEKYEKANPQELGAYGARGLDLGVVNAVRGLAREGKAPGVLKTAGGNPDMITKEQIFAAAHKSEGPAREILTDAAHWLGIKVAYLINIFNPQFVIIGGGMEKAGSVFMDPLTVFTRMYAYEESFNAVKILPSFLEDNAVSIGAAALSVRELFLNA
ncbi:MAG: ROK family protein [Candidatus Omnitrophota bacterium]